MEKYRAKDIHSDKERRTGSENRGKGKPARSYRDRRAGSKRKRAEVLHSAALVPDGWCIDASLNIRFGTDRHSTSRWKEINR